jgi:hypothetical protein
MIADTNPAAAAQTTTRQAICCQPTCPVCTGPLLPQRGAWRCSRCCFTLCDGCEGEPTDVYYGPVE